MNTITKTKLIQHHNITAESCFDLTQFTNDEAWELHRDGIVTYDEADHMGFGNTLMDARAILAAYECTCDLCENLA